MSTPVLAFDMFGTLADPASYAEGLAPHVEHPQALAQRWRRCQLEISWLLSLAERYEDWPAVTAYALDVTLDEAGLGLTEHARSAALAQAATPALFDDVPGALTRLQAAGFELAVFSNGTRDGLHAIAARHHIDGQFSQLISCQEVGVYKPAPATYQHAAGRLGAPIGDVWLVSGNPFDCAGAALAGMRVAKIDRQPTATYPFAPSPDVVVTGLADLPTAMTG